MNLKKLFIVSMSEMMILLLVFVGICFKQHTASAEEEVKTLNIEDGQELFGRTCQQCHNSRGIGGKCPTLVRGAWIPGGPNSDEFMFSTIHDGRDGTQMGAFGEIFTDEEIWAIVKYLRLESARIQKSDAEVEEEDSDRR